ncbi:hypothetical protein PUN28_004445 [Cardiocondyla obscurior]|uniref:Uncharacterized protein n=1 Tax=Cardiocondyla obscurior TaxID=286306 RepID=A0AAW2GAT5_9HYME
MSLNAISGSTIENALEYHKARLIESPPAFMEFSRRISLPLPPRIVLEKRSRLRKAIGGEVPSMQEITSWTSRKWRDKRNDPLGRTDIAL